MVKYGVRGWTQDGFGSLLLPKLASAKGTLEPGVAQSRIRKGMRHKFASESLRLSMAGWHGQLQKGLELTRKGMPWLGSWPGAGLIRKGYPG